MSAIVADRFPDGNFIPYREEFLPLCIGSTVKASTLCLFLSVLVRWSTWSEDVAGLEGWFFKTAKGFLLQDALSRWDYEQARKWFVEKGIIEYRRAGWCGVMHWRVNFKRLYELLDAEKQKNKSKPRKESPSNQQKREAKGELTAIKLPKWVDAELFEAHLQHCYSCHKSTNKDAQRGKLKQLEMARQKGHDVHVIQANAVGGGWLNFYAPNTQAEIPPAPSMSEIYQQQLAERAADDEQIRLSTPPEQATTLLAGIMDKLKNKNRPPGSG